MATDQEALLLQISADTSRLEKQFAKAIATVNSGAAAMEARADRMGERMVASVEKADLGKALSRVYDSSKLATLEEGGAKLRIFGSALEPLGVWGLAAAAGVVAVSAAMEQAIKATEWAEDLTRTAKALGVTTDALQQFDFIARATGIPVDKMRESLKGLNQAIGSIEDHSAKSRVANLFKQLQLDPATLKSYGDLNNILPVLLDRIGKLNLSGAVLADVAKKLRVDPEVLASLLSERDHLAEINETARAYGIVIDADVIQKTAEAGEKMHIASAIMDAELKKSFIELAPVIAGAEIEMAKAVKSMADFIQKCSDAIRPIADLVGALKSIPHLGNIGGQALKSAQDVLNPIGSVVGPIFDRLAAHGAQERQAEALRADLLNLANGTGKYAPQGAQGDLNLGSPKKAGRSKADLGAILMSDASRALDEAQKQAAEAFKNLTDNVDARAVFEHDAVMAEASKQAEVLKALELKIAEAKGVSDPQKAAILAKVRAAGLEEALASAAKDQLIQRQKDFAIEDTEIEVHKAKVEAMIAELQAQADITTNAQARAKIELDILKMRQQLDADLRNTATDRKVVLGGYTPAQGAAITAAGDAADAAKQYAATYKATYAPIHDALNAAVTGGWPGLAQYMADKLKMRLVDTLADVFTNLVLGVNGGAGGGGGGLSNLLSTGLHFLGFADGTPSAPGGWSVIGERGPELMNVPKGSQIYPNSTLRSLSAPMPSSAGGGHISASFQIHVDATNALVTEHVQAMVYGGIANSIPLLTSLASKQARRDSSRAASLTIR